jgi:hypothetical protein
MTRGFLLLTAALSTLGCHPPCNPTTIVYWSFDAPGLATPSTCAQAGIDTVSVWADGDFLGDLPCAGPHADGIQLIGYGDGNVHIQLQAWAGGISGTQRYAFDRVLSAPSCDSSVDAVADALSGRLDLEYLFSPVVACVSNSFAAFQLRGPNGEVYDQTPAATRLTCGAPDPVTFPTMPPGVYTLSKFEVGIAGVGTWTPDYNACAAQSFIHAGDSTLTTTLAPAGGASCWP